MQLKFDSPYADDRREAHVLGRTRDWSRRMKLYVSSVTNGTSWMNEWFPRAGMARDSIREARLSLGWEGKVYEVEFPASREGVAAVINASNWNPINFPEIEGAIVRKI